MAEKKQKRNFRETMQKLTAPPTPGERIRHGGWTGY